MLLLQAVLPRFHPRILLGCRLQVHLFQVPSDWTGGVQGDIPVQADPTLPNHVTADMGTGPDSLR